MSKEKEIKKLKKAFQLLTLIALGEEIGQVIEIGIEYHD